MPPARKTTKRTARRGRLPKVKDDHHTPAIAIQPTREVWEVIGKDLPANVRQDLTVKQIGQLVGECQVWVRRCPVVIDISSDNEDVVEILVDRKPANQFSCNKCNETYSWRPNYDYLCGKTEIKGNRPAPYSIKLKFNMNCNCNQV